MGRINDGMLGYGNSLLREETEGKVAKFFVIFAETHSAFTSLVGKIDHRLRGEINSARPLHPCDEVAS